MRCNSFDVISEWLWFNSRGSFYKNYVSLVNKIKGPHHTWNCGLSPTHAHLVEGRLRSPKP
jgi:hypothetical protein